MQKNRPPGKKLVKSSDVNDGGLRKQTFIDYLWRHANQTPTLRTLEELFQLVNASFAEKHNLPVDWERFVMKMHALDKEGNIKSEIQSDGRIVFRTVKKPVFDDA